MKRKLFMSVLCVAMVLLLSLGVLIACNKDKNKDVPPGPEVGSYYCDNGAGAEHTLELENGNNFKLVIDGVQRGGTYALAAELKSIQFTFGDGAMETLNAQIIDDYDKISFSYNGTPYTFWRVKDFTVTFVTGEGGDEVAPVTVTNGKVFEKPANPHKQGEFVFEGWYVDEGHTTKYDFDTRVSGDFTLYANFVSAIKAPIEFAATFAGDGSEGLQAVGTIQGVLYELPEPKKAGDKFVGWWVSDSNEGGKLTYKYDGQKLFENTVLYAVWKSQLTDGMEVSVTSEGVTWSGASDVDIVITDPQGVVSATLKGKNGAFAFGDTYQINKTGEYKLSIKASGSGAETTRYFVNNKLARVSVFNVEGNSLKFNQVANATSYKMTITAKNGNFNAEIPATEAQNDTLLFDFSQYDIPADGYVFKVQAVAEGYAASNSDPFNYNRFLNAVAELKFDDATQTYSWDKVPNALSYVVKVNGEDPDAEQSEAQNPAEKRRISPTELSFRFDQPGTYNISVQPISFGYNSPAATTVTFNKTRLAAPKGFKFGNNGTTLVWDKVEGAAGYVVTDTISGVTAPVESGTSETLSFPLPTNISSARSFTVEAKGNSDAQNSPKADALVVSNKVEKDYIKYSHNILSWNMVYGASEYTIEINSETGNRKSYTITDGNTSVQVELTGKENDIKVSTDKGSEANTTVMAQAVTFDRGYVGGKEMRYLLEGDTIEMVNAKRIGYNFSGWQNAATGEMVANDSMFDGSDDIVFLAAWQAQEYNLVFDFQNKASVKDAQNDIFKNQTIRFDQEDFTLPILTSSSNYEYVFEGWYLGKDASSIKVTDYKGTPQVVFTFAPEQGNTLTLYANWVEIFEFEDFGANAVRISKKRNSNNIDMLSEVTIPAQHDGKWVTAISDMSGCANMKVLNIPSSISDLNVAENVVSFAGNSALEEVKVYEAEGFNNYPKYSDIDGVLFENDANGNPVTLRFFPLGKLKKVSEYTVPTGTKTVASGAFYSTKYTYDLSYMNEIHFPSTVERIEKNAFYNIPDINTIDFLPLKEGETEAQKLIIESGSFTGDEGNDIHSSAYDVTVINLPKRFSTDSFELFNEFRWLEKINVIETGGDLSSIDGVLCKKSGNTLELVAYPLRHKDAEGNVGTYSIPDSVTKIGAKAFYHNTSIKKVTFGGHVTNIGESAFEGCMGLATLSFLGTKTSPDLHIAKKAFYGYYKDNPGSKLWPDVAELTLPANLVELGEMAFANLGKLNKVFVEVDRDSVNFAVNAFVDIEVNKTAWVTYVKLGPGVPEFEISSVFGGALKTVDVDPGNKYFITDENDGTNKGALYNQDMTKLLFFSKSFEGVYNIPLKITEIAASLFTGCTMTEVKIHNNVTRIGDLAFKGCNNLTTVEFTDQQYAPLGAEDEFAALEIGVNAFKDCVKLVSISLPEGLTKLNEGVFSGCSKLEKVHLPSTLKEMALKSASSEASEGEVGDFTMFEKCNELSELTVADGNENYGAVEGVLYSMRKVTKNDAEEYVEDTLLFCSRGKNEAVNVPGTVRTVQKNAFSGSKVTAIIFNDLVGTTNVGENEDIVDLTIMEGALYNTPELQRLHLPEGMKRLDQKIFYNTTSQYEEKFDTLEIPASMTFIGASLFEGYFRWNSPLTVTFAEAKEGQSVEGLTIEDAADKKTSAPGSGGDITVKKGLFVTIGSTANKVAINLAPITFPSHLVHLGNEALYQTNAESVTFTEPKKDDNGSYKFQLTIGNSALYWAKNIKSMILPGNLTSIGNSAFYYCSFSSLVIPENVTYIGTNAFEGSTSQSSNLTQLTFAGTSKLATIGESAFSTQGLTQVNIPVSVTSIGKLAFSVNKLLTQVTFEDFDKIADLDDQMQQGGDEFKIEDYLLTIGDNAFAADSALSTITLPARLKSLGSNAFLNSGLTTIEFAGVKDSETVEGQSESPDHNKDHTISHLESIGDLAFKNTKLTSIAFPRTVNGNMNNELTLGINMFVGCTQLTEVTLSSTVFDIGNVFAGIGTLNSVKVNVNNSKYMADENGLPIIYDKSSGEKSIALVYADTSAIENLTLTGQRVGAGALTNITGVKHVIISTSIIEIGERAFENCVSLETVTIEAGSNLQRVGAYAFQNCLSLTSVDFSNATKLATFGDGVSSGSTSSANSVNKNVGIFNGCSKLDTVKLGAGVTKLGVAMFGGSGVKTVNLSLATNLEEFAVAAFANTPNLTTLILPAANDNKIAHLGQYAFYGSGVKELDFSSCKLLKATAPDKELATNPSGQNSKKKGINDSSQYAATFAFATELQKVTFPSTMEAIGQYTFVGCSALTTVDGIENVNRLCNYSFNAAGDVKLTFGDIDVTFEQASFKNAGNVQITLPTNHKVTFNNNTSTTSDSGIFSGTKIKNWTIRTQDTYSQTNFMFNKCTELEHVYVTKGAENNVTTIGTSMFAGCTSLVSVEFDKLENLISIGDKAFDMYNSTAKEPYENVFVGQLSTDGKSVLDLSKTKISTIGAQAFSCCSKLTAVKLPATLTKLGSGSENVSNLYTGVFYNCTLLESVDFSLCSNFTVLGKNAFSNCTSLDNVDMTATKLDKLYNNTFRGCTSLSSAKLPSTLTRFDGTYQFQGCTNLASIDLSKTSIATLPYNASLSLSTSAYTFADCTNLRTVKLSSNVTGIGTYAFQNCSNLESVIVVDDQGKATDSGISIISNYAFQNCTSLSNFDLSATTKIGTYAFANTGFTTITLPDKSYAASSLSASIFEGCLKLETVTIPAKFNVAANVANYMFRNCTALNNVVFQEGDSASTRTLPKGMFAGCTQLGAIDFSNAHITAVPAEFLKGASNISSVTLSENVKTINANAFENCPLITNIDLEKVETIGAAAFKNCGLTTLKFDALKSLGSDSLQGNKLTSVELSGNAANNFAFNADFKEFTNKAGTTVYTYNPTLSEDGTLDLSSVENIALSAYMFQGIEGLKSVILPKLPKLIFAEIPAYTFANSSVETVDLSKSGVEYINEGAFKNSKLKEIDLNGVQFILKSAFEGTQLESLIIPSSVSTIGEGAFANCSKLKSVKIDNNNTKLELQSPASAGTSDYPKTNNTKLGVFENDPITTLVLGNRVTTIPRNAFANISEYPDIEAIAELDLSNVTKVEDYAFFGSLFSSVKFGENLAYIGAAAFANMSKLSTVTFGSSDKEVEFKPYGYSSANETRTDANSFGVFEASALSNVVNMPTFVNTSTKAAEIGIRMFKDCPNLTTIKLNNAPTAIADYAFKYTPLESISLENVTTIGTNAFYETELTTINIPASVTSIGKGAFAFTPLTDVTFADGEGEITLTSGGTSLPTRTPTSGMVGEYDQSKHTSYGIFDNCTSLANVTLSNRVKTIGASMFYYCTALTNIDLPEGVTLGYCAFAFSGLTSVDLKNVSTLNGYTFVGTKLTELELPVSVTISGFSHFNDCDELTTVTFTNDEGITLPTTQAYNQVFQHCDKLTTVTVCEGVTELNSTFIDCENLQNVTLPDSLTILWSGVFKNCSGLKKLVLPASLTSIWDGNTTGFTFEGCDESLTLYFRASRSVAYAMTYGTHTGSDKVPYSPLPDLERRFTVVYGYNGED